MKNKLTPIILLLALASCSKDARKLYHYERAVHHAKKADLKLCKDTVIHDTVITDRYVHDTTIVLSDSVTHYETERIRVEHHFDHVKEIVKIKVECKPDTITRDLIQFKEVQLPSIDRTPKWVAFCLDWWWVVVVLVIAYLIIRVLQKLKVI